MKKEVGEGCKHLGQVLGRGNSKGAGPAEGSLVLQRTSREARPVGVWGGACPRP